MCSKYVFDTQTRDFHVELNTPQAPFSHSTLQGHKLLLHYIGDAKHVKFEHTSFENKFYLFELPFACKACLLNITYLENIFISSGSVTEP